MDEEQVLGNVGDSVTLGSETVMIRGLPILMSRAWRQKSKQLMHLMAQMTQLDFSDPSAQLKGIKPDDLAYMLGDFQDDLLDLVGYWLWLQAQADKGLKQPQESDAEQWVAMIPEDANDGQIFTAFNTIKGHAVPFGRPGFGRTKA